MTIEEKIIQAVVAGVKALYDADVTADQVQLQKTKKEFEGHLTVVVFPFVKIARKKPEDVAAELGKYLQDNAQDVVASYNVVKGFLNIVVSPASWIQLLNEISADEKFGFREATNDSPLVMIEYSSPNTNKPLHLGHMRNNLLGSALARIIEANGNKVVKTNIVNDRGIHICKSMLAWLKWGNGVTPETAGKKGDHLIGDFYVCFSKKSEKQEKKFIYNWENGFYTSKAKLEIDKTILSQVLKNVGQLISNCYDNPNYRFKDDYAFGISLVLKEIDNNILFNNLNINKYEQVAILKFIKKRIRNQKQTSLLHKAQKMLVKWEHNDPEVRQLWKTMNEWVYAGFDETYKMMGVSFDKIYYESDTYLEGKKKVLEGLEKGLFYRREDGSVWADLSSDGLDEKLLLRSDGTSVYMTQDIGTAKLRYEDYPIDKMIYVVGNEQNYHFQVLSLLLDKLGFEWGKDLVHFSYGMVELPNGKMKSREGTVVDADELMADMIEDAYQVSKEMTKKVQIPEDEAREIARKVGLGALKYFILKVDARKNMLFNPEESINFNGDTGPFIQYTYARIASILRKAEEAGIVVPTAIDSNVEISEKETDLIQKLNGFKAAVRQAGQDYSPSGIANYCYELTKEYNQFYHDFSILGEEDENKKIFRLALSKAVAKVVRLGMGLLGIEMPERM